MFGEQKKGLYDGELECKGSVWTEKQGDYSGLSKPAMEEKIAKDQTRLESSTYIGSDLRDPCSARRWLSALEDVCH